jgi:ribonucleoside-diphosphate reductase alpha chain
MAPVLIKDGDGVIVQKYTIDMLDNPEKYKEQGYTYQSGWQACNLTEINCSMFEPETIIDAVKAATILGTIQATYTKADYLGDVSEQIVKRESLLGVSLTGMANKPWIFDDYYLSTMAKSAVKVNKDVAELLNIPQASRITCVKPSGNAAVLLGCASGIHPEYHTKYIRRVQVNANNEPAKYFKTHNPLAVQDSVWSAPGTTDFSIMFPIQIMGRSDEVRCDQSAESFLHLVQLVQKSWVSNGVAVDRVEGLSHNVSNTCVVKEHEWDFVADTLWANQDKLTGISLLGSFGDYVYDQPPFQAVYEQDEINAETDLAIKKKMQETLNMWNTLRETWEDVDYTQLNTHAAMDASHIEPACAGGACEFVAIKKYILYYHRMHKKGVYDESSYETCEI